MMIMELELLLLLPETGNWQLTTEATQTGYQLLAKMALVLKLLATHEHGQQHVLANWQLVAVIILAFAVVVATDVAAVVDAVAVAVAKW